MKNVLLEGKPGIGKTTVLKNFASGLSPVKAGGFYTEEIREKGTRVGFRIETIDGCSGVLSHIAFKSGPRVGKYRVNIPAFEKIGVKSLEKALDESEVILIDEIGKMELFSERFKEVILCCFDSNKPVVASVMAQSHPFVDSLKVRSDVKLLKVTKENRNQLTEILWQEIKCK